MDTERASSRYVAPRERTRIRWDAGRPSYPALLSSLLVPSLELSDAKVYELYVRALFGTTAHFCKVAGLKPCPLRVCCRAKIAHIAQSRPDSGLGFQMQVLKTVAVVSTLLGSGKKM